MVAPTAIKAIDEVSKLTLLAVPDGPTAELAGAFLGEFDLTALAALARTPAALVAILVEKLVSMIVPAAGSLMVIICLPDHACPGAPFADSAAMLVDSEVLCHG